MYSLYAKGYTHVVDGVQCQLIRVEERDLAHYRGEGWVDDVHSLNAPVVESQSEKVKKPRKTKETQSEKVGSEQDDLSNEDSDNQ